MIFFFITTIIEPRGVHVVHFTNFIRYFKRPGFWSEV